MKQIVGEIGLSQSFIASHKGAITAYFTCKESFVVKKMCVTRTPLGLYLIYFA